MRRHISTLLITTGLLVMSWPVVTWAYGLYWQQKLASAWVNAGPGSGVTASPAGTSAAQAAEPVPFARLEIPAINLKVIVVDGVDGVSLRRGPGHLPHTSGPGESGDCVVAAHRDGWFRDLQRLQPGDLVFLASQDCAYEYVVDEKRVVLPDRADLLDTGAYSRLTLVTCTGPGYPHSTERLLVSCHLHAAEPL